MTDVHIRTETLIRYLSPLSVTSTASVGGWGTSVGPFVRGVKSEACGGGGGGGAGGGGDGGDYLK